MAAIDDLLKRVDDPALRDALTREFLSVRDDKQFGLVFERHLPESVRLPGHPVRKGLLVEERGEKDSPRWTVRKVSQGQATISRTVEKKMVTETRPVGDLVVVRKFGEPIYPGLKSIDKIERGGDKPWHSVINAENYHALETLCYPYVGKVDCVYIDPPYNKDAGGWSYNDKYIDGNDAYRHSKWLAFMERRLIHARALLKETGVLLVSIDDVEQAPLRLLCDQILGEENFVAQLVWNGGRKNDSRFVSVGHDYVLVYAKNTQRLKDDGVYWRERKGGLDEIYEAAENIWSEVGPDIAAATQRLKDWYKSLVQPEEDEFGEPVPPHPSLANKHYNHMDSSGRVFFPDSISWPGGGGPKYEVLHPSTGKPVNVPSRGWVYTTPERMQEMVDADRVFFGATENKVPNKKSFLDEIDVQVLTSVFDRDRRSAEQDLIKILGDKRFPHPKDTGVIANLVNMVSDEDSLVVDFFGGSGTTLHAVAALNQSDSGNRTCVLVTNNEVEEKRAKQLQAQGYVPGQEEWEDAGVFRYVTRPRVEAVFTGCRPDQAEIAAKVKVLGRSVGKGLSENVEFFELTYEDRDQVSLGAAFEAIAPLLWMRAGAVGPRIDKRKGSWALPDKARYGVLFDPAGWRDFVNAVNASDIVSHAFIVTDSNSVFQQVVRELSPSVEPVRLYENYLDSFEINTGGIQ